MPPGAYAHLPERALDTHAGHWPPVLVPDNPHCGHLVLQIWPQQVRTLPLAGCRGAAGGQRPGKSKQPRIQKSLRPRPQPSHQPRKFVPPQGLASPCTSLRWHPACGEDCGVISTSDKTTRFGGLSNLPKVTGTNRWQSKDSKPDSRANFPTLGMDTSTSSRGRGASTLTSPPTPARLSVPAGPHPAQLHSPQLCVRTSGLPSSSPPPGSSRSFWLEETVGSLTHSLLGGPRLRPLLL